MTVVLITSTNRYIGDTADTKPTGVPAGSTYFDRQTGILYITYDGTNYVEKPSDDTVAGLLGGGLPAALAAGGGLKVEGVAGGVAQPVSGTFWQTTQPVSMATAPALAEGIVDDAAFGVATSKVFPIGALADEAAPDSVDEGDLGALRMTLSRILWVALRGKNAASADTELLADSLGRLKVLSDPAATTPTPYNLTLTLADTEYSQAMPANCRKIEFQCRTEAAVRFAFVTGKVATPTAPYMTLKAGDYYYSPDIAQGAAPSTLYLASATAGVVIEILAWT